MRRLLTATAFGRRRGWAGRTLALMRTNDDRFTDLQILTILHSGKAGHNLAEVCAAAGISEARYYAWKAEYTGPQPSAVRRRRRRERRRRRRATMIFAALAALSVAGATMLIGIPDAKQSRQTAVDRPEKLPESRPTAAPLGVAIPVRAPNLQRAAIAGPAPTVPAVPQPTQQLDAAQAVVPGASTPSLHAQDIRTAYPDGYAVQVAAVPDLREARAILEQLADAGYPAYLTWKVVDRVVLYRVRIGPLESRAEAEETVRQLEREGHRSPWVTK